MSEEKLDSLKRYFRDKALTQIDISKKLGVSKQYVNSLLSGSRPFGKKQAKKWEDAFGISCAWLLTGGGEMLITQKKDSAKLEGAASRAISENLISVRFFEITPTASFNDFYGSESEESASIQVVPRPDETLDDSYCVFEIHGDSMAPQIQNRARVLCREISPTKWHSLSSGIIVIAYGDRCVIKRIIDNRITDMNYIELASDNPEYTDTDKAQLADIRCVFRAVRVIDQLIN